jgi:transcriptional regulator with XRE-family HTH domain
LGKRVTDIMGGYMKKNFGEDFERARKAQGYSSRDALEDKLGVSSTSIGNWERNGVFPMPDKWDAIKKHLGIDPVEYWTPEAEKMSVFGNRSAGKINAIDNSTVQVGNQFSPPPDKGKNVVELTDEELTFIRKYRSVGSPQIVLDKCMQKLAMLESMFG